VEKPRIKKEILIEELVENYPFSVRFLMEKGIRCIMCGEPIWGTLEEAAQEKGFTVDRINEVVEELNKIASQSNEN
jgi:methionine synthase II (cobalamin-independent)